MAVFSAQGLRKVPFPTFHTGGGISLISVPGVVVLLSNGFVPAYGHFKSELPCISLHHKRLPSIKCFGFHGIYATN